jgi:hypothetical protein
MLGVIGLASPAQASAAPIAQPNITCAHPVVALDSTPTTAEIAGPMLRYEWWLNGGWRPITGPSSGSTLNITDLQWNPANPLTNEIVRVEILYPSGRLSAGGNYAVPAMNASGWDQVWTINPSVWPNGIGLKWRIQVNGDPSSNIKWFPYRCS